MTNHDGTQDVVQLVVHNQVTRRCSQLTVHYPMDSADHSLATILAHLKIVTCLTVNSNIIDLLKNIIAQPQQMTVCVLYYRKSSASMSTFETTEIVLY